MRYSLAVVASLLSSLGWLGSSGRQLGQFNWIHGLDCSQLDDGVLSVADMNNWRVQKLLIDPRR